MLAERLFELIHEVRLSQSEKDWLYEHALESYLSAQLELEELITIRNMFYGVEETETPFTDSEGREKILVQEMERPELVQVHPVQYGQCARCGRKLEQSQVMFGERYCIECQRTGR